MKKLFIIAMCLLSLGISSCKKDSKNDDNSIAGTYKGAIKGTPTVQALDPITQQPLPLPFEVPEINQNVELLLEAGATDIDYKATIKSDFFTFSADCTSDGKDIFFAPFQADVNYNGIQIKPWITPSGKIDGNNINFTCDILYSGEMNLDILPMPILLNLEASLTGTLTK